MTAALTSWGCKSNERLSNVERLHEVFHLFIIFVKWWIVGLLGYRSLLCHTTKFRGLSRTIRIRSSVFRRILAPVSLSRIKRITSLLSYSKAFVIVTSTVNCSLVSLTSSKCRELWGTEPIYPTFNSSERSLLSTYNGWTLYTSCAFEEPLMNLSSRFLCLAMEVSGEEILREISFAKPPSLMSFSGTFQFKMAS